jgi:hypothetical protein
MTINELMRKLRQLQKNSHGDEEVYLLDSQNTYTMVKEVYTDSQGDFIVPVVEK